MPSVLLLIKWPCRHIKCSTLEQKTLLFFFIGLGFCCPFLYHLRLTTSIFRFDFYLIWIAGCYSWRVTAQQNKFGFSGLRLGVYSAVMYVIVLTLSYGHADQQSIFFLITLLALLGIINYLKNVSENLVRKSFTIGFPLMLLSQLVLYYHPFSEWLSTMGGFGNTGFLANYLLSLLPFLFALAFFSPYSLLIRRLSLLLFIAGTFLLIETTARAAYVGLLSGCLFVLLHFRKINLTTFRYAMILGGPGIMTWLYFLKTDSAKGRLLIYRIVLDIVKDHPLTGIGPNRFAAVYNTYQSQFFRNHAVPPQLQLLAQDTYEAFNSILQVLVEYGLLGLLLAVLLFQQLWHRYLWKQKQQPLNWSKTGSWACLLGVGMSSLFSNPFHLTPLLIIVALHIGNVLAKAKIETTYYNTATWYNSACLFGSLAISMYSLEQIENEVLWWKASRAASSGNYAAARNCYMAAYKGLAQNGSFLYNYGAEASQAGETSTAIRLLEGVKDNLSCSNLYSYLGDCYSAKGQYSEAEHNYLIAAYMVPCQLYPKYALIQLYKEWQKPQLAKEWLLIAMCYPQKIKTAYTEHLYIQLNTDSAYLLK